MYEQRTFMPLRYEAFKQRVRRFPRSVLLRRLAAVADLYRYCSGAVDEPARLTPCCERG